MIEAISKDGLVMVELENLGEGLCEDYDPNDPEDMPLLRFTIYRMCNDPAYVAQIPYKFEGSLYESGEWMAVSDGSYCTQIRADLPEDQLKQAADYILNHVEDGVRNYSFDKRLYEALSWTSIENGVPNCEIGRSV